MTTFKLMPHAVRPETQVVEIWADGNLIGEITPINASEPCGTAGIRILSKFEKAVTAPPHGVMVDVRMQPMLIPGWEDIPDCRVD